jgi:ribosome-associated protein
VATSSKKTTATKKPVAAKKPVSKSATAKVAKAAKVTKTAKPAKPAIADAIALPKLTMIVIDALEDIKAKEIRVLDVAAMTSVSDFIAIATADSNRQTRALANNVIDKVKAAGYGIYGTEGEQTGEWVLVDCGDIVVHIMQPAIRDYYKLEELYLDAKVVFPPPLTAAIPTKVAAKKSVNKAASEATKKVAKKVAKKVTKKVVAKKPTAKKVVAKKVATKVTTKVAKKVLAPAATKVRRKSAA